MLPLFVLAHYSHHVLSALLTPLLPSIRDEFALDYTRAGWIVSAFTLSYGISQVPAGWLADRIGPRVLLAVGVAGVALAGLLAGLSPTYVTLAGSLILLGIAGGGYHPASAPLVSTLVKPENRGRALGLHQIGGTLSYFSAPLIAVAIASALTWRGSFIVIAVPVLAFGIIFYLLLGRVKYTPRSQATMPQNPEVTPPRSRLRYFIPFIALGVTTQIFVMSTIFFIPLFAVDSFQISEGVAATLLSTAYIAGLWAGPLGGYLSDRIGKVPIILTAGLLAGPLIYLLNLVGYGWGIYVILLFIGASMYMSMPVSEAYIISQTPERNRSTVLGVYYFASRGGPGLITPVVGYIIDRSGFQAGFAVMGGTMLVIAIAGTLFLWKYRA
ncbi:MAG: MFS transporter [Dehalococcoidales bacterium]|nr:MFS transporter [Dehalococcoidales bacterium]